MEVGQSEFIVLHWSTTCVAQAAQLEQIVLAAVGSCGYCWTAWLAVGIQRRQSQLNLDKELFDNVCENIEIEVQMLVFLPIYLGTSCGSGHSNWTVVCTQVMVCYKLPCSSLTVQLSQTC